jgi:hypothetical protein
MRFHRLPKYLVRKTDNGRLAHANLAVLVIVIADAADGLPHLPAPIFPTSRAAGGALTGRSRLPAVNASSRFGRPAIAFWTLAVFRPWSHTHRTMTRAIFELLRYRILAIVARNVPV